MAQAEQQVRLAMLCHRQKMRDKAMRGFMKCYGDDQGDRYRPFDSAFAIVTPVT